ncbi:helix-turn-helix domain-containing protein [Litchfieldia alkalitelluris]|uniref:helix-turn-helix domain-containing protein n=1 Tax=Litchfieldia alkalitelluris TaxID=304268 RepID=UPI000997A33D|nr:helix-turn-helix transcriptional regulator [Litchfieldia alkalitelluris]
MNIGNRIKMARIHQNMTQAKLSKGIISISYLSKIEHGLTTASREVLEMLCERLGLPLSEEQEVELIKELKSWYQQIVQKNSEEASSLYKKYKNAFRENSDSIAFIYFCLFEIRYLFTVGEMEKAKVQLLKLELIQELLDRDMNYYYQKFLGLYNYLTGQYTLAKEHYQLAERLLVNSIQYEKWEEANLYYSMGLTYSQTNNPTLTISYTKKALVIYQSLYDLKRCAECHILHGIGYVKTEEFSLAEDSYRTASKLAYQMDDIYLKGLIHHNLGYLLSLQERTTEAIKEFESSLEYKETGNLIGRLKTILSLTNEYYLIGNVDKSKEWIREAKELLSQFDQHDKPIEYDIHFTLYDYLTTGQFEEYEITFKKAGMTYFKKFEMNYYLSYYSEILAKHYESVFKYKQACYYYAISTNALKKQNYIY